MGESDLKLMFALQWAILAGVLCILGLPLWIITLTAFMSLGSSICSIWMNLKREIKPIGKRGKESIE